jgi:ribonuclease HII
MPASKLSSLMAFDRRVFAEETGRPAAKPRSSRSKSDQLKLFETTFTYIVGVDEVGRGCLAGPVVACAVMLPVIEVRSSLGSQLGRLDDSKVIPAPVRDQLRDVICASSYHSVAEASVAEIDEINILNASLLAMKRAVCEILTRLPMGPHEVLVLVDGNKRIKDFEHQQKTVVQGDSHSASIAAASVVAKVYRDRLMCGLANDFPHYLWHRNKGYGSKAHRDAIEAHGVTDWHRRSFRLFKTDDENADENASENTDDFAEEIAMQEVGMT